MDIFDLTSTRVQELVTDGFDLIYKVQNLVFPLLIDTGDISEVTLSWSQARSLCLYVQGESAGRLERVNIFK